MRDLMRQVVNWPYTFHAKGGDPHFRAVVERWMAVARLWDEPKLDEGFMARSIPAGTPARWKPGARSRIDKVCRLQQANCEGLAFTTCSRHLTGHAVMSRESIRLYAAFLSYAINEIRQLRRRGDGGHQALPTQAAHKAWHATCGGRQLPLSFDLAAVPELGVASIVNDKCVSRGRVKLAVRREGGGKRVSRQLINIFERARLMIAACRPREQMGHMLPIPDADLGQSAGSRRPRWTR